MPAAIARPPITPAPVVPIPVIPNNLFLIPLQSLAVVLELVPSVVLELVPSVMDLLIPLVLPSDTLKDFNDSAWPFISLHWKSIPSTSLLSIGSATTK